MKLLFFLALPALGGCLTVDSVTVTSPACASGTCQTGPGITSPQQLQAAMSYQFRVEAHNSCKTKAPMKGSWLVEVSFYDGTETRIGISTFYVGSLLPAEKVRYVFQVPGGVLATGTPATVRVRSIVESPEIQ